MTTPHSVLTARRGLAIQAQAMRAVERDEQGRVWCQLFPRGQWSRADFPSGKGVFDDGFFRQLMANWQDSGRPALPVDYYHEEREAAGWIEDLRITTAGLEGLVKWTDRARASIEADELRYLSPTWVFEHLDRRSGAKRGAWLFGAAILNDPFFDSMPRVAAASQAQPGQGAAMDRKRVCAALGMAEDSTDDMLMEKLEAMSKHYAELTTKAPEAEKKVEEAVQASAKAKSELAQLQAEVAKLQAREAERDFADVIKAGLSEGRQGLPGMVEHLKKVHAGAGIEVVKAIVSGLPNTVPQSPVGVTTAPDITDYKALKAAFDKELDEASKGGESIARASARLARDSKYAPLFTASSSEVK